MTGPAGGAAPVDNSPSLASFIGELHGDYSDAEPESHASEPLDATLDTPADTSEGTSASAPASEPLAPADATAAPDPNSLVPTDQDPFEGSTPHLAYTVDGQERTFDGITVLKDGTAIIDSPETVQRLQRMAGERDHLFEKDKAQYEKYSGLEKVTSWQVPTNQRDAQGRPVYETLTGQRGVEAMRVAHAESVARVATYEALFKDPQALASLLTVLRDEAGNVTGFELDARELKGLQRDIENATLKFTNAARQNFSTLAAPVPPPPAAPTPVSEHAMPTIEALAKQHNVTGLTVEDKAFLAAQFPQYVGADRTVNPLFLDAIKRAAQLSAGQTKVAEAATAAATTNAARLAAANIGKNGKQPQRLPATKEPERTRANDFDEQWDRNERAAAGALRAAR